LPFLKLKGEMRVMDIKIGEKTYKIEYNFEAALYEDCVTALYKIVTSSADGNLKQDSAEILKSIAGQPNTVVTLFYAGLMENNAVADTSVAKGLLKQYFIENKGNKEANFYGIYKLINKQMEDDCFFDLIGLSAVIAEMTENAEKLVAEKSAEKQTQDHKPKKSTLQK